MTVTEATAADTDDTSTETTETATPVNARAAAAEAARKALIEAGAIEDETATPAVEETTEEAPAEKPKRGPDGKFLKPGADEGAPAEKPATEKPKDENRIAVELRARQRAQRVREEAEAEARQIRDQAVKDRAEAERMRAEYEPYKRAAEAFQKDPQAGIRELAAVTRRPPRELVDGLLTEGAPDPVRDLQRKIEAMEADNRRLLETIEREKEERQRAHVTQTTSAMTRDFLATVAAGAENYPFLNSVYEDDVHTLVANASKAHREYMERTGKSASWDELAEYLEDVEREKAERYSKVTNREVRGGKTQPGGRANGHSPITAATSSRRASGPVAPENMTDEERRQAAIEAAKRAQREYRGGGA